jgi:DNA-binding winged helix-turn-helix (wHTH) protein/tetratricopeptide (TPR) repeat protein
MSLENSPKFLLNFSEVEMNGNGEKHFYQFKSFRLNVEERQLLQNESVVSLTPKAFDLLAVLVEQNGHLVEKDELLRTVWADSFVEEANIPRIVHTLRKTLGEDENGNKFIETVAKKGYRFVAEVTEIPAGNAARRQTDAEKDKPTDAPPVEEKSLRPRVSASPRLILFAVGFLSAAFLILFLSFSFRSDFSGSQNTAKSIAVLPVKPINAANRDELYEIGIAAALIDRLGTMKGFLIRPLEATRKYADIAQDPIAAGREQQTDYVLASNYQIADGRVRLTAQLYSVRGGQIEETYKIEKEASGVFAVQDAIAGEIGNLLKTRFATTLGESSAKRGTTNEEAYRLYLQGKNMRMKRNLADFKKSIEYFEQAIRLDPNYASAYAGLAGATLNAEMSNVNTARGAAEKQQSAEKVKEILARALQLDPNLADAYAVRGNLEFIFNWNLDGAEKNLLRALELEPNNDHAHWVYSLVLAYRGRFDEAFKEIETAQSIHPGALMYMRDRGRYLYYTRRYDEAISQLKRVIELDENFVTAYGWLWRACELKGDTGAAYDSFIKRERKVNSEKAEIFQKAYETGGWQAVKRKHLEINKPDAIKPRANVYFEMAGNAAFLGEKDHAFEFLGKAVEQRDWQIIMLNVEPMFDPLRDDPRFDELVRRAGLK